MRPCDRQRPWRVSMRSPPERPAAVATHCTQSATVDNRPVRRDPSHKWHAPRHLGRPRAMRTRSITAHSRESEPTFPSPLRHEDNRRWHAPARSATVDAPNRTAAVHSDPQKPPARSEARLNLARRIANPIRFPFNGFTYFLTLFSKCFSSFPHGTCSLSVSCRYLALDGVYHPFWAAFPNNPTLRKHIASGRHRHRRGCHPL